MSKRATDTKLHPKALERQEEARGEMKAAGVRFATSTILGLVSLYPIIHGTRTDNHVMLLIGGIIAIVSFKVLPTDDLASLISAWRKG